MLAQSLGCLRSSLPVVKKIRRAVPAPDDSDNTRSILASSILLFGVVVHSPAQIADSDMMSKSVLASNVTHKKVFERKVIFPL